MSDEKKQRNQKTKDEQWDSLNRVVELFRRYFSGEASQQERNIIDTWDPEEHGTTLENDSPVLPERFPRNRDRQGQAGMEKDCDTDLVWNAISRELQFDQPRQISPKGHLSIGRFSLQIAAAAFVLISFGVGFTYWHQVGNEVNTTFFAQQAPAKTYFQSQLSGIKTVNLPDGSIVTLNRGTKLAIVENQFNKNNREVWLEGEAFFEVAKNKEKPFIVHSGAMQTTVRGTSFNVKAYPQLNENVVSVRSGKVIVSDVTKTHGLLTHNKQLTYNTTNKNIQLSESNWEDAAGWREGRLVFRRAGMNELKLRLMQLFNVELEIRDNALNDDKTLLNSSFAKGTSLKEIMDVVSLACNVKYDISNPHKIIIHN